MDAEDIREEKSLPLMEFATQKPPVLGSFFECVCVGGGLNDLGICKLVHMIFSIYAHPTP